MGALLLSSPLLLLLLLKIANLNLARIPFLRLVIIATSPLQAKKACSYHIKRHLGASFYRPNYLVLEVIYIYPPFANLF